MTPPNTDNTEWLTIRIKKDGSRIDPENVESARMFDKHCNAIANKIIQRKLKQQDIKSRIDENNLLIGADSISGGDGSDFDPTEYASNRIAKLRSKE